MDKKFYAHLKAYVLSHQIGEDPNKTLAKIKVIANTNPNRWDGKLPTKGFRPDNEFCHVAEAKKDRPVVPWWWYGAEKEPIPAVVKDIYKKVAFDFAVMYPQKNAWIYILVEPTQEILKLLSQQEHLKAFILISLINKKFPKAQREHKRLRLGTVMGSKDLDRIFTFVAFQEQDERYRSIPRGIPTLSRVVHPASNTANWNVRLPGDGHVYGTFQEIVG
ncbi:MAG: hypothetical protein JSV89_06170 [Spirochaetaceae bacterium]|nr:MAG: hypothetical protein JSV89_06170 [Spirochaetaceae bacterium]